MWQASSPREWRICESWPVPLIGSIRMRRRLTEGRQIERCGQVTGEGGGAWEAPEAIGSFEF